MTNRWPLTFRGTGALILALACFVLAGELGTMELLYVGTLLIALILASILLLRIGRRADGAGRAVTPDVVPVGQVTLVSARVPMDAPLATGSAQWTDRLPLGLAGTARGRIAAFDTTSSPGVREALLEYTATATRRGVWTIGPLSLRTTDPFGIARRTQDVAGDARVIVVPTAIALTPVPISAGQAGSGLRSASDELGQGSDNLIARPYAPGDSVRRIHWRATAHRDELMVRQEEQESARTATVMIDRSAVRWDPAARHEPGADPLFETALSTCVSIILRLAHDGYLVRVRDSDGLEICDPVPGADAPDDTEEMLIRFATMLTRRDDSIPALAQLFTAEQTGPLVVVAGRLELADADAIAPVAHRSGLPVLLSLSPAAGALDRAGEAGWRTSHLLPDTDLRMLWADVAEGGGRRVAA